MPSCQDLPIFEQLAVLSETALWHHYMPFCSKSESVARVTHSEIVGYFCVSVKLVSR